MKILFVVEQRLRQRTGGSIRQDGFVRALRARGTVVDTYAVGHLAVRSNFLTRYRGVSWRELVLEAARYDAVHVEGLPLHGAVRQLAKDGRPVVWDVCDSWAGKYRSAFSNSRNLGDAVRTLLSLAPLLRAGRRAHVVYIAERDLRFDRRLLGRLGRPLGASSVVPNGVDIATVSSPAEDGVAVMFADWTYPPNRRAYEWVLDAIDSCPSGPPSPVSVFGRASEKLPRSEWVQPEGYVEDLGAVFERAGIVLAPSLDGAGVKNKVLESAALGIPVVTTPEGMTGIPDPPSWLASASTKTGFIEQWRSWAGQPPVADQGRIEAFRRQHSWERAADLLLEIYAGAAK